MKALGVFEIKTRLSQVCEEVARTRESVLVTKRGKPFVRIVPIAPKEAGDSECCVSVFCELEILQGLILSKNENLTTLYWAILKGRLPVLDFTVRGASVYAELQALSVKQGKKRPVIDLSIAASALVHGCNLVTLNVKDFADIPGLVLKDWST